MSGQRTTVCVAVDVCVDEKLIDGDLVSVRVIVDDGVAVGVNETVAVFVTDAVKEREPVRVELSEDENEMLGVDDTDVDKVDVAVSVPVLDDVRVSVLDCVRGADWLLLCVFDGVFVRDAVVVGVTVAV